MDSSPPSSSLAGRLKSRFRRAARHPEEAAGGGPAPSATAVAAAAAAAAAAASAVTSKSEEASGSSGQEELAESPPLHPDLDDCAELSELLLDQEDDDDADDGDGEEAGGGRHQASKRTLEQPGSQQQQQQQVLKDLQAQLMALAIENEALRTRTSQADSDLVRDLRRQLSAERGLRRRAEEAAADAATRHPGPISRAVARLRRRRSGPAAAAKAAAAAAASSASLPVPDGVDIESLDSSDSGGGDGDGGSSDEESPAVAAGLRRPPSLTERLKAWTAGRLLDLMEDLQQPAASSTEAAASEDAPPAAAAPEDNLSARRLKANVTRFGRNARAPLRCLAGARDVLRWRWPSYTFAVAMTYYIALRYDLLLPLILLLCIARLGLNYFKYRRHWAVEFNFLSAYENPDEEEAPEKERTVGTQVNFVVHVAKKVQNLTGKLSDNMEKFKNLVTWRCPGHTQTLLSALIAAFAATAVLPASTCLYYAGLYLGFKLLAVNALFDRYPRLKRRHDSVARLWRSLPTDQQLSKLEAGKDVAKYVLPHSEPGQEDLEDDHSPPAAAAPGEDEPAFCQAFDLPQQERPLDRWRGSGKRCAIVCKDAERVIPLLNSLKHGRLFLTRSFLCFERSKDRGKPRKRNLVIPLAMVRWARKAKTFAWFPGGGMSIEVQIVGIEKPITFGAIIGRDEAFDSLVAAGRKAGLAWAGGPSNGSAGAQQQEQQPDPKLVQAVNQALLSDSDIED